MWKKLIKWFEAVGTARAAAELARNGHYEIARKMMLEDK
jgi:hypothetical protein